MATRKAKSSTNLGRDSESKRRGVKRQHGQFVGAGEILVRQCGTRYVPGKNVRRAGDDTLYAAIPGTVQYNKKQKRNFDGSMRRATHVNVVTQEA